MIYPSFKQSNFFVAVFYFQEGRTALHYAAALQGTTSGVNQLFSILVEAGADENVVDVVSLIKISGRTYVLYEYERPYKACVKIR